MRAAPPPRAEGGHGERHRPRRARRQPFSWPGRREATATRGAAPGC